MGFPIAMLIFVAAALNSRIPRWRDSVLGMLATTLLIGAGGTVAFSIPLSLVAGGWLFVVATWSAAIWVFVVNLVWRDYLALRGAVGAVPHLPHRMVALGLVANLVPTLAISLALPIWGLLFQARSAGLMTSNPVVANIALVTLLVGVAGVLWLAAVWVIARSRNPWYPTQMRLLKAAVSSGADRESALSEALSLEPQGTAS